MCLARGRAANKQRHGKPLALHLLGDVRHFVERRRDKSAQSDDIDFQFTGRLQDFFARNHDTKINDLVVVATQDNANNVFADVVNVTLDRRHEDFALGARGAAGLLFRLHERKQPRDGFLHDTRAFDHLRQKHFARPEQIAHNAHAGH